MLPEMRTHALVLAGGTGDRFGADMPKQFVRLAGEPILLRSIGAIVEAGIDRLVVVKQSRSPGTRLTTGTKIAVTLGPKP